MRKGYLFISNSTKPSQEVLESTSPIGPNSFSKAAIWTANELGWELHMGVNRNHPEKIESVGYDIKFYNQHTYRNIFALRDNWIAYQNLCKYLKANPQIEIIHCNTPIGGVVGRLVGKKFRKKVIYTAHGFHFYKGAPFFNRTVLKWIEKSLAQYTDVLITINQEDFETAQKFKLKKGGKVLHIPGVGIDLSSFNARTLDRNAKRRVLNLNKNDYVLIAVGDLNDNKNMSTLIKSIQETPLNSHLLLCGEGPLKHDLKDLSVKIGVKNRCHFLGFRKDIIDLLQLADIFVMASKREGLPRSTMEAMALGLPCIVSDIRGNRDLIDNGKGGFLVNPTDAESYANAIKTLIGNLNLRKQMGEWNLKKIQSFDINTVKDQMYNILKDL